MRKLVVLSLLVFPLSVSLAIAENYIIWYKGVSLPQLGPNAGCIACSKAMPNKDPKVGAKLLCPRGEGKDFTSLESAKNFKKKFCDCKEELRNLQPTTITVP